MDQDVLSALLFVDLCTSCNNNCCRRCHSSYVGILLVNLCFELKFVKYFFFQFIILGATNLRVTIGISETIRDIYSEV